ncbi:MAG: FAD-binding oxidoreductase [Pseudomonadota bacterium]
MNAPPLSPPPAPETLDAIRAIVGPKGVFEGEDAAPFLTEWRGRWAGAASLIVAPASTRDVAAVIKLCARERIAVTPQGGNTGLVGGQLPFGPEILLSLRRMRTIRDVSPLDNAMTVDAGVTLSEAQEAAKRHDRLFALSIGSEGSCQIGGAISTNAGGVNVVRYGNMRDQVLGLEVVTPAGDVWDGLKTLRKDNTGYDLKHLFIGGEGTLGVVTGAVVKLHPHPRDVVTAFIGVPSTDAAVALLAAAQDASGGLVSSFELMSRQCLAFITAHIEGARDPLRTPHPWYVLAEFSSSGAGRLREPVEALLAEAFEDGLVSDAAIAENERQAHAFWHMRHAASEAINHEGLGARHDVSVPTAQIPAFLKDADAAVERMAPGARVVAFGHIGDGNIHYDVAPPLGAGPHGLDHQRAAIEKSVYDVIAAYDGSISAEHGVGRHRRDEIAVRKSPVEMAMMRAVKKALDPHSIMNPGKML